ncbi:AAA family ATPase [Bacillus wiedmannii]|uniref:AAA family ATPase n=1 Tax=Bacillus wiedmannii TaxID=1890302 RepID=A0A2B6UDA8_9BACI|nr:AAA family ATPase [Bacillus wiedmannii]PHG63524.1 AAA family ATPase [Bacillus wiedmannii]
MYVYDFTNLSDVEFEKLCADILSRKLGVKLRYFAPGRDGGIDLVDDASNKNIVVQVKHYAKSSFKGLLASLKKEVDKVEKLKPNQYYICVSQQLTAANISEIYELFKEYMKDTSNIITRDVLVDFLDKDSNQDILRKNFKLWLLSDKLLKDIFNNQVFIDSEVLLDEINEEFKYFVQTKVFNEALEMLKKHRLLMLYGAPGVGKSINSKMLAAAFVKEGYIIRYTTDGQVSNIKNVISKNPDVKEVVLLDDCLGQYYFKLKEGQDQELISLIKYINQYETKVLILNTRVTILNEAKRSRLEFRRYLEKGKIPLKTIDMENISSEEKAEIFYNHLLKNKIPKAYYDALRVDRKYRDIINHKNYNPRIMEFVTEEYRYSKVNSQEYYQYILKNLNYPNDVWADEFEEKLEELDRIFMYTLFSLTDTYVDRDVLEECFIFRLNKEGRAQSTIDYFSVVESRLTKSLVKILDDYGSKKIGVLNPSINDYMNSHIHSNKIGLNAIKESILYIEQIEKMYEKKAKEEMLIGKLKSGDFINLKSLGNKKISYLFCGIAKYKILNESYKPIIENNFNEFNENLSFFDDELKKKDLVVKFLKEKPLYDFYEIDENLKDENFRDDYIEGLNFEEILEVLSLIKNEELLLPELTETLVSNLLEELDYYLSDLEVYDYIDDIEGFEVFYDLMPSGEDEERNEEKIDEEIQKLCSNVRKDIREEIRNQVDKTIGFETIKEKLERLMDEYISEDKMSEALTQHFYPEPDYDDYDEDRRGFDLGDADAMDVIFDREYPEE